MAENPFKEKSPDPKPKVTIRRVLCLFQQKGVYLAVVLGKIQMQR